MAQVLCPASWEVRVVEAGQAREDRARSLSQGQSGSSH